MADGTTKTNNTAAGTEEQEDPGAALVGFLPQLDDYTPTVSCSFLRSCWLSVAHLELCLESR